MRLKLDYPEPYLARAQMHHWEGRLPQALADIDFVLNKLAPAKKAGIWSDRADVLRTMGRLDEAAADYQRAIDADAKRVDAYVGLATVYEKQGKMDEALDCYERMVAADPESFVVYLRRAEFRRNHRQFEQALADCDEAARRNKNSILSGLVRASVEAARGDYRHAVAKADRLLPQGPAGDGHVLSAATRVFSLASQAAASQPEGKDLAKQYADRALALLGETLDKGFHDLKYEEHNRLRIDPALSAIRSHPRFRELLPGTPE